jgi:microcompartment protein CcmL/EutN
VLKLPSRALSGASALLEGASVVADQPVRSSKVPLTEAEQFEPGTAVVVVVGAVVVVVVAAEAGEMLRARKPPTMASVATIAVPGAKCQSLHL